MRGLHPDIKAAFEDLYEDHSEPHDRNGRFQRTAYAKILKLATKAESQVHSTQKLVARQMGQTFKVDALASQAERTFQQYRGTPPRGSTPPSNVLGKGHKCHGCGGDHHFAACPDKDKPHVIARAKRAREKFFEDKVKGKRGRWNRKEPNLTDLSPAAQAKITQQVIDAQAPTNSSNVSETSSITGASLSSPVGRGMGRGSTAGHSGNGKMPFIFLGNVFCLASATKEILPVVPINTALPHILLQLGASDMKGDAPTLSCTVDSAAAICIGNSHFFFQLAKTFPACVAAVYTPDNYSPIILSGIVQRNGEAVTTDLCVAFVFNLPYYTVDGQPAQIMFGAGPHVNVNCILGIPFITASRMLLDFGDNVAECRALGCPPFPLQFKKARLCLPDVQASMVAGHDASEYSNFLADLETLEAYVHRMDAVPPKPSKSVRRVKFQKRDARNPNDDGLSRYRPSADMLSNSLPRESLDHDHDLAGESQSAAADTQE
jgi:hypothetical protein